MNNSENNSGFIAGTLIHTQTGLKPIEQIQVGDWVLSQPEEKGELSYKRVTQTFVCEGRKVFLIRFSSREKTLLNLQAVELGKPLPYTGNPWVAVTGFCSFYTKKRGWVNASSLDNGYEIELADGSFSCSYIITKIKKTPLADIGWAPWESGAWYSYDGGIMVDFRSRPFKLTVDDAAEKYLYEALGEIYYPRHCPNIQRTVYNFKVEDNHTYYVEEYGIWVHDAIQQAN